MKKEEEIKLLSLLFLSKFTGLKVINKTLAGKKLSQFLSRWSGDGS